MEFGIFVLGAIIVFDALFMIFVMRMVLTEPPHKHPKPHPLALEYAAAGESAALHEDAPENAPENKDETLVVESNSESEAAEDKA